MGSSCTFPTLFFFSPFRVGAYQFLFPWRSPPNAKLPLPPSAAAAVPPAHTSMGNTWHHLKGPFLNSPLVFRHFLLLQRRIPSSSYSQLFWKKFKGRELVCVPLLPVKWFLSPPPPPPTAVHCCDELFTQMSSIAPGDPIFMSYSFVFVFGFTPLSRSLLLFVVVIKKSCRQILLPRVVSPPRCRPSLSVNSNRFPT